MWGTLCVVVYYFVWKSSRYQVQWAMQGYSTTLCISKYVKLTKLSGIFVIVFCYNREKHSKSRGQCSNPTPL